MTRRRLLPALLGLTARRMGMDMANLTLARDVIRREEGLKLKPYADSGETVAIGYGRNLTLRGISHFEAELLLSNDVDVAYSAVRDLFSPATLSRMGEARVAVLVSMAHQLGAAGLARFRLMRAALEICDWGGAAREALDSRWATQTPARARRVAEVLESGEIREG